jgi:hypothetical protein
VPKFISDDFFHPTLAASLGVAMPVKGIKAVRSRIAFQDWNVQIESPFPQARRVWLSEEFPGLKGNRTGV